MSIETDQRVYTKKLFDIEHQSKLKCWNRVSSENIIHTLKVPFCQDVF